MSTVILAWTFSPPNYFEEPIEVHRNDYVMTIADGKAEARISDAVFDQDSSIRHVLDNNLSLRFLAVQLLTHQPYTLSKSSMVRVDPQWRRNVLLEPESIIGRCSVGTPDLQVIDKDGNILFDARRDRIEKQKSFAELVEKYRDDSLLNTLLSSHQASVNDPAIELVHLYEIREALSKKFGDTARKRLGFTKNGWSRLGQLANDEPLRQGRHRGKSAGALRDATEGELEEARRLARHMIEGYLGSL